MPALVDQPGVLRIKHYFSVGADLNVSTSLYFKYSGTAPSDADCAAIASEARSCWNNAWLGHLSSARAQLGASCQDLTTPSSGFGESLITSVGGGSAEDLAASTCLLVNYHIARRYRGGKPRSYWPTNIAVDLSTPHTWDTGVLATMTGEWQTSYLDVLVGFVQGGTTIGPQVSVSYYSGFTTPPVAPGHRAKNVSTPRAVAITPDLILGFTLNPKPGTQRRRQLHSA